MDNLWDTIAKVNQLPLTWVCQKPLVVIFTANQHNELVIPLVLSEETLEIAERLIVHWLVEQRSKEEMERVLEEELALLGRYGAFKYYTACFVLLLKSRRDQSLTNPFIIRLIKLKTADTWRFTAIGLPLSGGRDKYAYFRVSCYFSTTLTTATETKK